MGVKLKRQPHTMVTVTVEEHGTAIKVRWTKRRSWSPFEAEVKIGNGEWMPEPRYFASTEREVAGWMRFLLGA